MKNESFIRTKINDFTASYQHVLDCGPATIDVNAPRALMQLAGLSTLNALYWVLGEERPRFRCDDCSKVNC